MKIAVALAGLLVGSLAFAQSSTVPSSRHAPILTPRVDSGMAMQQNLAATSYAPRQSAEEAGKRAMFTVLATASIFALLTLSVLGVVVYRACRHEPKLNSHTQARKLKELRKSAQPQPASAMIYTSDLYDVASRGPDGQAIKFQRTRDWHYDRETTHHMPQPALAKVQAQARTARTNKIPPRQTPQQRPTPPQRATKEHISAKL